MIYCCQCQKEVSAILTNGKEIYPHREDLYDIPIWKCPSCQNYVGCHWKTKNPTKPLGNIPNKEMRDARQHIHKLLDPLWKKGGYKRGKLYAEISKELGYQYHTAEIKTLDEARRIYLIIKEIATGRRAA